MRHFRLVPRRTGRRPLVTGGEATVGRATRHPQNSSTFIRNASVLGFEGERERELVRASQRNRNAIAIAIPPCFPPRPHHPLPPLPPPPTPTTISATSPAFQRPLSRPLPPPLAPVLVPAPAPPSLSLLPRPSSVSFSFPVSPPFPSALALSASSPGQNARRECWGPFAILRVHDLAPI
ncbi:hypothetical protein M758_2G183800 [Ceratodon purpureus]|nr:hypothetical protein M758_2G183800 [Ceratodon purpureus]